MPMVYTRRDTTWQVLEGDCRDVLRSLPAQSVHTVVTSPPYFGLRDYGHDGQLGLEATPDEFVAALVVVFREVRRVLRDDGTVWLNLGDSYAGSWGAQSRGGAPSDVSTLRGNGHVGGGPKAKSLSAVQIAAHPKGQTHTGRIPEGADYKPKDLIGVPWLVAFALRADGWYLRSEIIWHKPNPMPESVTDRPTRSHEQVFLLSKSARYWYDADAIREANEHPDRSGTNPRLAISTQPGNTFQGRGGRAIESNPEGRNKRSVWTVATQPYAGAHFATFPPKLIEPCILAGCPERCCAECGAPWVRITERTPMVVRTSQRALAQGDEINDRRTATNGTMIEPPTSRTVGWEPSCDHGTAPIPGTVLDPFAGAGTTGLVALRNRRSFIGIELNPEYAAMARDRIATDIRLGHRSPQRVVNIDGHGTLFDTEVA